MAVVPASESKWACWGCIARLICSRIRKVKCDEGYPACHRCLSTGRACDWYDILGGGIQLSRPKLFPPYGITVPQSINTLCLAASAEEKQYLDWFKIRTVPKLPGSFLSEFWSHLLLQASLSEPAILHASLALSAVHKTDTLDTKADERAMIDQFALRHYVKAINHLKAHFAKKDKVAFQVILIACVVFISLESLRGHLESAQVHIENGLKIIKEANSVSKNRDCSVITIEKPTVTDDWIVEAVSRLDIQSRLTKQSCSITRPSFRRNDCSSIPRKFRCFKEAWKTLDILTNDALLLSHTHCLLKSGDSCPSHQSPIEQRKKLLRALRRWLKTCKYSQESLIQNIPNILGRRGARILTIHHTMTTVMAELCLCSEDEMAFDSQIYRFAHLLDEVELLFDTSRADHGFPASKMGLVEVVHSRGSIMDLGCISPLYYLTMKCRVHRIRLQAIALLERCTHREGIWDAGIAALVGRKVMEIEERGFFGDMGRSISNKPSSCWGSQGLPEPILPESQRIGGIEMVLSGNPTQKIALFGTRHESRSVRSCLAEYDMASRTWVDR